MNARQKKLAWDKLFEHMETNTPTCAAITDQEWDYLVDIHAKNGWNLRKPQWINIGSDECKVWVNLSDQKEEVK